MILMLEDVKPRSNSYRPELWKEKEESSGVGSEAKSTCVDADLDKIK